MEISVFGLGYVGAVSAACFARQGHRVIGVDISLNKVNIINRGDSPVIEKDIDRITAEVVSDGRLRATTSAAEAVLNSDVSLVCVGTPSSNNGSLDLTFIKRVAEDIAHAIKEKDGFHTIVVRSTVLPGATENHVIPILEEISGGVAGQDFGVCFNPEFLREGTSVYDFYHPPYTVIGCTDPRSAETVSKLYQNLDAPLLTVPIKVAETVKYANNAFHALKVTFANEIGNICKQQGVDSHQVMDIFCMDEKLNLSPYYLKPGYAFGGSCLPKDLRALLYHGHSMDLKLPLLESILPSNENQVKIGFELVRQSGKKKVGVLGFSFKAGTDDLRESPLVELIERLIGKGYHIQIYDQNVSMARLHGANKAYIEQGIPHIASLMSESLDEVLANSEVIVIGNKATEFKNVTSKIRPDQIVIDLVRIIDFPADAPENYQGICW